jgi:hypothetical protein
VSKQAIDALARWIAESVRAVPAEATRKEAQRLANEFTAYATDAGISIEQLEEDIGRDLVSRMEDALKEAADTGLDDLLRDDP